MIGMHSWQNNLQLHLTSSCMYNAYSHKKPFSTTQHLET